MSELRPILVYLHEATDETETAKVFDIITRIVSEHYVLTDPDTSRRLVIPIRAILEVNAKENSVDDTIEKILPEVINPSLN